VCFSCFLAAAGVVNVTTRLSARKSAVKSGCDVNNPACAMMRGDTCRGTNPKCLKTGPKVTARGELRRTVGETQNSAESLPATNETAGRLLL